ncbi:MULTISPECIES: GNAT family N-acetyltransferase [unclassified Micromonospora]|uniref:GNAT family N-acetyltransferase n=1 Tax=unclassified Micromonospora TaxID=2617518 RepID=UPI003A8BFA5A
MSPTATTSHHSYPPWSTRSPPPRRRPHTYLAYLGVAPDRQRHGMGTALLTHRHTTCDTAGTGIHLVATSHGARRLYQRHGYYDTTPTPIHLPDGGPPLWPMWRQPRTPHAAAGGPGRER